ITPGRRAETCCSSFRICRESVSIFVFCRSIFLANSSSRAESDLSPDGSWAEAVVHIVAAKRKVNEPRAKLFMEAILAERHDGGKRAGFNDLTIQRFNDLTIQRFNDSTTLRWPACLSVIYLLAFFHAGSHPKAAAAMGTQAGG